MPDIRILLISGSTRPTLSNSMVLRELHVSQPVGVSTDLYQGLSTLPVNLLDWTVGGGQLYDKLAAWLDVANPGRGAGARGQLGTVLSYVAARVVEPACVHVNLDRNGGAVTLGDGAGHQLQRSLRQLTLAIEEDRHARGLDD